MFRSPVIWDKYDLNYILAKGDQLSEFFEKIRYFGMKELPQELLVEKSSINVEFLRKKERGNYSWATPDIYFRNSKWFSAN